MTKRDLIKDIDDIIYLSNFLATTNQKETKEVVKYLKKYKKSMKKKERCDDR